MLHVCFHRILFRPSSNLWTGRVLACFAPAVMSGRRAPELSIRGRCCIHGLSGLGHCIYDVFAARGQCCTPFQIWLQTWVEPHRHPRRAACSIVGVCVSVCVCAYMLGQISNYGAGWTRACGNSGRVPCLWSAAVVRQMQCSSRFLIKGWGLWGQVPLLRGMFGRGAVKKRSFVL